jgi:hypothetical protein
MRPSATTSVKWVEHFREKGEHFRNKLQVRRIIKFRIERKGGGRGQGK